MAEWTIRDWDEGDIAALTAMGEIYNHYVEHSTCTYQISRASLEGMRDIVKPVSPRHAAGVLRLGDRVAGYGLLQRFKAREAYADSAEMGIYLAPGDCGRGLGRLVLDWLESRAQASGFHALLAGISADNDASLRLFAKAGYAECARFLQVGLKFGRRLDVVYMEKLLP